MTCKECQLACYDLLDQSLSAKDEREVLAHVEQCPACRAFLETESGRMRTWPRLLGVATRRAVMPDDTAERVAHALEVSRGRAGRQRMGVSFRPSPRWYALAASLLALACMAGAVVLLGKYVADEHYAYSAHAVQVDELPAVRLISQKKAQGAAIPTTLPGTLTLASGELMVRLTTGVELTLLGPAKLTVQTGMRVSLEQGQLLARVPRWATGFAVLTRELEIYDLGTVFSVSADDEGSETFVFKGSVQVNEASEWYPGIRISDMNVGICVAGEGVRARTHEKPVPFDVDGVDAELLFAPIRGCAALKDPDRAMQTVREIGDRWIERHMPASYRLARDRIVGEREDEDTALRAACAAIPPSAAADGAVLLYNASPDRGRRYWEAVDDWFCYQISGGGSARRLPGTNDTVRINAATLAAEKGSALVIGHGIHATCMSFASAWLDYPGTTWLRLEGGSLTSQTTTVIGMAYPALATLEGGTLATGTDLFIGGYAPSGRGVVTNNGATLSALRLHLGHETNTYGRLVHNGGVIDCRADDKDSSLQVGFNGGVGEFVARAEFSAYAMGIGGRTSSDHPLGTGTVAVLEGAVGDISGPLRVRNGSLAMRGGTIRLQRTHGYPTNLFVRQDADAAAVIRGWGRFTTSDTKKSICMIHNGVITADGEGIERDLDFNPINAVNHDLKTGDACGWYAVNKGRVLFPHACQTFTPGKTVCWGDLSSKPVPELVNSVALRFTAPVTCAIRGGFCASDRRDIPAFDYPAHLRPLGIWCIGAYSDNVAQRKVAFVGVSLTFRFDDTRLRPTDRRVRLYRHDGKVWHKVGECAPQGARWISTDFPLAEVTSGDYNIGWFAVMAVEKKGTVFSIL
ncbi:MAG TPA: FecR domain-containing protein [Kiritimatiellia bacterium]|nr:FecR domain-containing protein [Kiritimatiellia bacterium]